jgi:glycosyltransferase involved in cell wall biosynthesis
MKILYLVHQFFPKYYYGTERLTLGLAEQMQRMGHSPLVMTYDREKDQQGFVPLSDNVLVKKYTYGTVPVISFKKTTLPEICQIFDPDVEEAFSKLELKYDIVHVCHPMWLSSIARSCKGRGVPVVLTLTDPWLLCPAALIDRGFRLCDGPELGHKCASSCGFIGMTDRYREALGLFGMADEVVTASRFTALLFKKNGWNRPIRIIPHSVDYRFVRRFSNDDRGNIKFAYIGSISWHKGVHVLVRAFQRVQSQNVSLRVYGSTREIWDYSKEVLALARKDERIKFLDSFDMDALPYVMKEISALVVPSVYYDNFPLVTLIGLAYRVPVIGSRIGGIPEIINHGVNGLLFQPGNSDELASVIEGVAREPEIIQRLAENIVTPRRTEEEALDYENIYMKLTSR